MKQSRSYAISVITWQTFSDYNVLYLTNIESCVTLRNCLVTGITATPPQYYRLRSLVVTTCSVLFNAVLLLRSQKPSEDVWVLSTLYEMVFLKQALERLDWQADELASQHKDGVITGQLVVLMVSCHGCQVRGGGAGGLCTTFRAYAVTDIGRVC